jgi:hypothetical protein
MESSRYSTSSSVQQSVTMSRSARERAAGASAGAREETAAMTVYVALLRGINVGGRSMLPMAQLRTLAEDCGFEAVRSYIQSGNLVFSSPDPAA